MKGSATVKGTCLGAFYSGTEPLDLVEAVLSDTALAFAEVPPASWLPSGVCTSVRISGIEDSSGLSISGMLSWHVHSISVRSSSRHQRFLECSLERLIAV